MEEVLLNDATGVALQRFISKPSHALIISGPNGSGKTFIAKKLAAELLDVDYGKLANHPGFTLYGAAGLGLGIEDIRALQGFLKLKTTGTGSIRRICLVQNAHNMTSEAQNALLKTLEEPPLDTVIILTAVPSLSLKPTIYSRAQILTIKPTSEDATIGFFTSKGYDQEFVIKCYRISGGLLGLMTALIKEDKDHRLVQKIEQAKEILSKTKFERLAGNEAYWKDKNELSQLLFAMKRVSQSALEQAVRKNTASVGKLHQTLKLISHAEQICQTNPNSKLLLTNLFLSL